MFKQKRPNQDGDTIVSILLSLAVLGATIVIVYNLVGTGLKTSDSAARNNQGLTAVQVQLERLKWMAANDKKNQIFFEAFFAAEAQKATPKTDKAFCLDPRQRPQQRPVVCHQRESDLPGLGHRHRQYQFQGLDQLLPLSGQWQKQESVYHQRRLAQPPGWSVEHLRLPAPPNQL